ncbi:major facilitator superfamily domain-containing protein [Pilobolus umbonatus]|nr:major facilitator superfamily domain-containing protein [Pilobolus umbonatus]
MVCDQPEEELAVTHNEKEINDLSVKLGLKDFILTIIALQVTLFLAALEGTIIATALPRIGSEFNEMLLVSWVSNAYILGFDVFQPLFSKFSDIFGRKIILIIGVVIFLIASAICGAANSMIMLIVGRAIAGIGGSAMFSMVFIIVADIIPLEKRGCYQGLLNAVFALASVFGPLIGGSFTDYVTWRWNFYINLPIGAVALIMLVVFMKLPVPSGNFKEKMKSVDYLGAAIVLVFATLFLLALNFGGVTFPWNSPAVIVLLVLSGLFVVLLAFVESRVKEPLMPLHLFKKRSISSVLITNWFLGIVFFSLVFYMPIYLQVVRGDTATMSGIRMIPFNILISVFSTFSGLFISKTHIFQPLLPIGMALLTISVGLLTTLDGNTSYDKIYGFTALSGIGLGVVISAAVIALQACAEPRDVAVVTGLGNFSRILGGALGVAISSAIVNSSLSKKLLKFVSIEEYDRILKSTEYIRHGLPKEDLHAVLNIYTKSLHLVWYVMTGLSGAGFIASMFSKSAPLLQSTETSNHAYANEKIGESDNTDPQDI